MKIKKLCAVALALAMACSMLVGCVAESAVIELTSAQTTAMPGGTIELAATVKSGTANGKIVFQFSSGSGSAILTAKEDNKADLTIRPTAAVGDNIVIKATDGKAFSNEITVTVTAAPVGAITLTSSVEGYALRGETIAFAAATDTSGSSANIVYAITEGGDYATLSGSSLKVKDNAPLNSVIKVVASVGSVTSNECSFLVDDDAATTYEIMLNEETIEIDKNSGKILNVKPTVIDADGKLIKDKEVVYSVTDGFDFVSVKSVANTGILSQRGHGVATVKARIVGTNGTALCTVNSIVPPSAINAPSDLPQSKAVKFAYSRAEKLVYAPVLIGEKVCTDYKIEFKKGGEVNSELAIYDKAAKAITFADTTEGEVVIVVTSQSGSAVETMFSQTVLVNNGFNVRTMQAFLDVMDNFDHQNDKRYETVNLMANIQGMDGAPVGEQTIAALAAHRAVSFGNRYIYGNDFTVDLSNLRLISHAELVAGGSGSATIPDFLTFIGKAQLAGPESGRYFDSDAKEYTVEIVDLAFKGNIGAFTATEDHQETLNDRAFRRAIRINPLRPRYYPDNDPSKPLVLNEAESQICKNLKIENVLVDGFAFCMVAEGVVGGEVKDCTFGNSYLASVEVKTSTIEFRDIEFTQSGMASFEASASNIMEAGENFDQKATVTFKGKLVCDNFMKGTSPAITTDDNLKSIMMIAKTMISQKLPDGTVPSDAQMSNFIGKDSKGKEQFNWLIFAAGNPSNMPAINFQSGTLKDYYELTGTAADHQYEYLKVTVTGAGVIYGMNLNYVKPTV